MTTARITASFALPTGAGSTTLYTTVGPGGVNAIPHSDSYWLSYAVSMDQDGEFVGEWSNDGSTWNAVYSNPVTVAVAGTPETAADEVDVEGYRYFRLRFVNGGTDQGEFVVNLSLSDQR